MLQGLAELNQNLKLLKTFTAIELITAMEKSQNLVATHAKSNHVAGKPLSRAERKAHPDARFYSWSSDLVNSIHAEKVEVFVNGIKGEVTAGEKYATAVETGDYNKTGDISAIGTELGTANRRAFPFMGPALAGTAVQVIALFGAAVKKVIK